MTVSVPDRCDVCGADTVGVWDVHMVLRHPETRPRPQAEPRKEPVRRARKGN